MNKVIAAVAASAIGLGVMAVAAPAADAATHRASIACTSPANTKANYSWGDGATSVTVYFNNHCSGAVSAGIVTSDQDDRQSIYCLKTNGGTSGKKKFDIGLDEHVIKIKKGCTL
ncbi:hypothetical protein [Kutzneria sp. 744]|uniref:hypothetical protein n=1 Tax=Kutzneria sp. (strain 744) TaxID=345341 RepID=UPI0003EECF8A|nr:hypothetical protein [Kutzneria sp. 744]EWM13987.1 hypothetical protein KUTG_04291 [Kutzneria sp. 744]